MAVYVYLVGLGNGNKKTPVGVDFIGVLGYFNHFL